MTNGDESLTAVIGFLRGHCFRLPTDRVSMALIVNAAMKKPQDERKCLALIRRTRPNLLHSSLDIIPLKS